MELSLRPFSIAILSFFLVGCNVPLGSYPRFWDYTKTKPKDDDLVGIYKVVKLRLPSDLGRTVREKDPVLALKADHTVVFTDVPKFDRFGDKLVCRLSGSANWALNDEINSGWGWSVVFQDYRPLTKSVARECDYENSLWGILILSRHAPYRLYAIIGDPDSDTGVEFSRVSR
jgi:hypothetical protein